MEVKAHVLPFSTHFDRRQRLQFLAESPLPRLAVSVAKTMLALSQLISSGLSARIRI